MGNLIGKTAIDGSGIAWTYGYDNANNLTSATETQNGSTILQIAYTYDVFGNRLSETVTQNGTTTTTLYSYDANNTLYADLNSSGTITTRYISGVGGPDLWLAQVDATGSGNSAWLLSDYQGTVTNVTRAEYDFMRRVFDKALNRMIAIKPGGKGDISETHVLWSQRKNLPVVASPLLYQGRLYLIKTGGIMTVLDAKTGQAGKPERLPNAGGDYYSSPVGGDGKVYCLNERGNLTVLSAGEDWKVLHRARFEEDVYATPALVDGRIYLRTAGHLYCFGIK